MQTCYLGWLMTSYRLVGRSFTLSNLILTDVVRELICHGKSVFFKYVECCCNLGHLFVSTIFASIKFQNNKNLVLSTVNDANMTITSVYMHCLQSIDIHYTPTVKPKG